MVQEMLRILGQVETNPDYKEGTRQVRDLLQNLLEEDKLPSSLYPTLEVGKVSLNLLTEETLYNGEQFHLRP